MSWDQKRIRRTFLDYFVNRAGLEHREVPSSPLIPKDDNTLLFANAGMNQFKSLLLGEEKRDYTRATSVQKCIRAGGKHNDLDAVGKDGRHLTFFEMLGNWSFGDYYKLDSIKMSWDLSVNVFGLDPDRIYVSVYKDDDESFQMWVDEIGFDPKRIYRFGDVESGDEENFWSMGPTGPCGPCTELFYDLGPEAGTGPEDYMGGEGDRYMEFWNNVFMQSNRDKDGNVTPLALQSVDTGMGLERITMILQGKVTAYDTDLFQPILKHIQRISGGDWGNREHRVHMQVIADHIRCLTHAISDGGAFGNTGREYVLKRILRRAVRHGYMLGFERPFMWQLIPTVAELFEGVYDLPSSVLDNTTGAIKEEEEAFFRTIGRGMGMLEDVMQENAESKEVPGKAVFTLYDTYGFPLDLTEIIADEKGFSVDHAGYQAEMAEQKKKSGGKDKFYGDAGEWVSLGEGAGDGFAGYGLSALETSVIRWRTLPVKAEDADQRPLVELVLQATPFYAESGGEAADRGALTGPGFTLEVTDVQKVVGIIHHFCRVADGSLDNLAADTAVSATVDVARRAQKTVHHTATHLLHAGLQATLGEHVQQKGSVVDPDRLRFDFSHKAPMTAEELDAVEGWVNARIRRNDEVVITEGVSLDEAKAQGVTALFGEKYGDSVRTVRAGAESFELCGGNHVARTGDIGLIRITGETGVSAGVRRIEAVVAHAADAHDRAQRDLIRDTARAAKAEPGRLPQRVESLLAEIKDLSKALDKARRGGGSMLDTLLSGKVEVGGLPLITSVVDLDDRKALSALVDAVRDKLPEAVVILGADVGGSVAIIGGVGPRSKGKVHVGNVIKEIVGLVDGRGGGRPDFAQGGGKDPSGLAAAIEKAAEIVTTQLG